VFTIGFLPSVVGATSVYATSAVRALVGSDDKFTHWALYLATGAIGLAAVTVIAVSWHRLVLLEERPTSVRPSLGARHLRFWLWSILLVALTEFPGAVFARYFQSEISVRMILIQAVAWALLAYLQARLSLLLPAIAIDHPATALDAFKLSSGNGVRLATAMVLVLVPVLLAIGLVAILVPVDLNASEFKLARSAVVILGGWALTPLLTCTEVGVLSLAYQQLEHRAV
jgi:hypothetical protein